MKSETCIDQAGRLLPTARDQRGHYVESIDVSGSRFGGLNISQNKMLILKSILGNHPFRRACSDTSVYSRAG